LASKIKTVLIVGGCGLIGKQLVKDMLDDSYQIVIGDIQNEHNNLWLKKLPKDKVLFSMLDVTRIKTIDDTIKKSVRKFGGIDACVNLAYPRTSDWGKDFQYLTIDDLTENLKTQLGGQIILSQRIIKYFLTQNYGNLILVSSIQGVSPPKFDHYKGTNMTSPIEYSAIKSGVISITRWLSKYYKNKNIRVNCISPGGILDGQDKIFLEKYKKSCNSKGMLDPKDISGSLLFLISDNSKYINGQNIIIDDGWTL